MVRVFAKSALCMAILIMLAVGLMPMLAFADVERSVSAQNGEAENALKTGNMSSTASKSLQGKRNAQHDPYSIEDVRSIDVFNSHSLIAGFDEELRFGLGARLTMIDGAEYTVDFGYCPEFDCNQSEGGGLYQLYDNLNLWRRTYYGNGFGNALMRVYPVSGTLESPGSVTVRIVPSAACQGVFDEKTVVIPVIENPVVGISVSGGKLLSVRRLRASEGSAIERNDVTVIYRDGTSASMSKFFSNSGLAYDGYSCSSYKLDSKVYPDFNPLYSCDRDRHRVEYVLDEEINDLVADEKYPLTIKYLGAECTTYVMPVDDISKAKISIKDQTYSGKALKPKPIVSLSGDRLEAGVDYTVTGYANNKNAGTATVTIKGKGDFKGTATSTFKIKPVSLAKAKLVLSETSYAYNKKVRKPKVTKVQLAGGKVLKPGVDYAVSYSNKQSKAIGRYTVSVVGKGNYAGKSTKATYLIGKKNPFKVKGKTVRIDTNAVKSLMILYPAEAYSISGNKGGKLTFKKVSGDKALKVASDGTITIAKNTKKGVHSVKVAITSAAKGSYARTTNNVVVRMAIASYYYL